MKVYISGQITGLPKAVAEQNFLVAEKKLLQKGYEVVNPMKIDHSKHDQTWNEFMKLDIKYLCDCDAIFLLKNWYESKGANMEYLIAERLDYKIIHEEQFT